MTRLQLTAFLALCLVASAQWIAADALPAQLAPAAAQGLHLLLIGLAVALVSIALKKQRPALLLQTAAAGVTLYAAPLLLLQVSRPLVSSSLTVVIFSLLPVVIAIATGSMKWLFPTLLGTSGVLVLVPVTFDPTPHAFLGLALIVGAMLLTATAILWLHRLPCGPWTIATVCLSSGLALTLIGLRDPAWSLPAARYEALRALLDAPEVLLLLFLISILSPRRLSARWLLAPLFTVLGGFLLMRPPVDARLLTGLALLAFGSGWRLLAPDRPDTPETTLNLRPPV